MAQNRRVFPDTRSRRWNLRAFTTVCRSTRRSTTRLRPSAPCCLPRSVLAVRHETQHAREDEDAGWTEQQANDERRLEREGQLEPAAQEEDDEDEQGAHDGRDAVPPGAERLADPGLDPLDEECEREEHSDGDVDPASGLGRAFGRESVALAR